MVGAALRLKTSRKLAARRRLRRWAAAGVLALPALVGCESTPPAEQSTAPQIVAPAPGAVLLQPRIEVGILVRTSNSAGRLEVYLQDRDISDRFTPAYRRMRTLGGAAVATATIDIGGEPPGDRTLRVVWTDTQGRPHATTRAFRYVPPAGRLRIHVRDQGKPVPARLWIEGVSPTPTPDFTTPGAALIDPREREAGRHFLDAATGDETLPLAPGRYRVTAARGIEYSVARQEVEVLADQPVEMVLDISNLVPTPGWIGADLHVHAAPSLDSFLPLEERVVGFLAAGVEVIVGSDHQMLTDYGPAIAALPGASRRIVSLIGVEASLGGSSSGHWTLFPFPAEGGRPVRRWPRFRVTEPADLYRTFREGGTGESDTSHPAGSPGGIVELNHPRGIVTFPGGPRRALDTAAWFETAGFDPGAAVPGRDETAPSANAFLVRRDTSGRHANLDFDALEILNRFSLDLYKDVRRDWFALLQGGLHPTATANTDSHHRVLVGPGFPRNLVHVGPGSDTPATFDPSLFLDAIRRGSVVGTTGPVIDLRLDDDARPGDTVVAHLGRVRVRLQVRAAPWIPVREARIIEGGRTVRRFALDSPAGGVLRLDTSFDIDVTGSTWLLAEAGESLDGEPQDPGPVYRLVAPGFVPIAFTNPVFVTMAGNDIQ